MLNTSILFLTCFRHRRGLLTRPQLSADPVFGITLDRAPELDGFHFVFGRVVGGLDVRQSLLSVLAFDPSSCRSVAPFISACLPPPMYANLSPLTHSWQVLDAISRLPQYTYTTSTGL